MDNTTTNSLLIQASPETLYRAFTDPAALAVWLAPGDMTGEVHHFETGTQLSLAKLARYVKG